MLSTGPSPPPPNPVALDWVSGPTPLEGLVRGQKATLYLTAQGPPRLDPAQPVVVFEAGLGATSACWGPVARRLDGRLRNYRYDRAGYGRSPSPLSSSSSSSSPPAARTAEVLAAELLDVLAAAGVRPPYLLVAHSYGGIIAREVLAQVGSGTSAVAGLVLVDANSEATDGELRAPLRALSELASAGMPGNYLALLDLTGLLAGQDQFTAAELAQLTMDQGREAAENAAAAEWAGVAASSAALAAREQLDGIPPLDMQPVTVIRGNSKRDYQRVLDALLQGESGGGGRRLTSVAQAELRRLAAFVDERFDEIDGRLQRAQLCLSAVGHFIQAKDSGHAVIATEPQLVADAVLAVGESCQF